MNSTTEPDNQTQSISSRMDLFNLLNTPEEDSSDYSQSYTERTAYHTSGTIMEAASTLRLDNTVAQTAGEYYILARDNDIIPGASQEVMVGAVLRAAAMKHGIQRPLSHIAAAVDEDIGSIRTKLTQLFDIIDIDYTPTDPEDFLSFLIEELEVPNSDALDAKARDILSQKRSADESFFYGKSPVAIACGALYAASRFSECSSLNQRDVTNVGHVSEVTIRNHYKPLLKAYDN